MAATDKFLLPEDVVIAPVADLPKEVQAGFAHAEGDYAVTRPRARSNSTIVDAHSAALLERFRTASTIIEAVVAYSAEADLDPHQTLEDAFDMLSGFVAEGVLVMAGSELARPVDTSLSPGERIDGFELLEPVHVILDTEVYRARAADGGEAALKVARPGCERQLEAALAHEAGVLERLGGEVGPRLLAAGAHEARPFLAVSWCAGVDVLQAAQGAWELEPAQALAAVSRLGEDVIAAYARLHGLGIAHGDVHPRNALVEADGSVRLIDFGLAVEPAPPGAVARSRRGGVDFFLEPEVAVARLAGKPIPAVTAAGEQYAVAALVYLLLGGRHTHEFSLEPEEMLRQLADTPALPLDGAGKLAMPAMEAVIARALEKDPERRHVSMAEFHRAFAAAAAEDRNRPAPSRSPTRPAPSLLLDEVLERLGADGDLFTQGIPAPTASVMNGGAGFAYALGRVAGIRGDAELLALADLWAVRAQRAAGEGEEAFWNEELEIVPEKFGENSLFHHRAGVECVPGLLAGARGDEGALQLALEGFLAAARGPCEHLDVTFGRAGLLLGACQLLEALPPRLDAAPLREVGDALRDSLWGELEREPALEEGPELGTLGAAHGWAGYLFSLLRWSAASASPPPAGVETRLDQLGALARPVGRGLRWPYVATAPLPHTGLEASWCNGAAGYVPLWTTAHRLLGEDRYERWARMAAWTAWESPVPAVGDLCCGFAGRSYALLSLYRHGGEEIWLARARRLAEQAATEVRSDAFRRDSLYKGEIGVALLAADLEAPGYSCMPLFDSELGLPVRPMHEPVRTA
ncbi:MAG TPA: lanthionine synthetase LanC family protein [Solirubrobacterales bacterium]|nr:lanthionine synthetase LanC family protein [Solirubrobacterales bacterium]